MEQHLDAMFQTMPILGLTFTIVACLMILGNSADNLVDQSVNLSYRLGLPKVVIGATIVSLGTTTPEVFISVLAAFEGKPGLAIGNAVGSIICDTGLILGITVMFSKVPVARKVVGRQGWLQVSAGLLLVVCALPWSQPSQAFEHGGNIPRWAGVLFLSILLWYFVKSIAWAREEESKKIAAELAKKVTEAPWVASFKLVVALMLLMLFSKILVLATVETSTRLGVKTSVIASSVIALGTSLPELLTAVTAIWKRHSELALGNIIGADILNVLLVVGTSAVMTADGLTVEPYFFKALFPAMLSVLLIFRLGVSYSKRHLEKIFGVLLLCTYFTLVTMFFIWR